MKRVYGEWRAGKTKRLLPRRLCGASGNQCSAWAVGSCGALWVQADPWWDTGPWLDLVQEGVNLSAPEASWAHCGQGAPQLEGTWSFEGITQKAKFFHRCTSLAGHRSWELAPGSALPPCMHVWPAPLPCSVSIRPIPGTTGAVRGRPSENVAFCSAQVSCPGFQALCLWERDREREGAERGPIVF